MRYDGDRDQDRERSSDKEREREIDWDHDRIEIGIHGLERLINIHTCNWYVRGVFVIRSLLSSNAPFLLIRLRFHSKDDMGIIAPSFVVCAPFV